MSARTLCRIMLFAAAGMLLSVSQTPAQCTGTLVYPSADEATGPGQIMGGTYVNAQSSNGVREALNETLQSGVSRLYHRWSFPNVPAGYISIIRKGYRLPASDGDNFRFRGWYDDPINGPYYFFGNICPITSETEGTLKCDLLHETYDMYNFHFYVEDTIQSGAGQTASALGAVSIDFVAICSEECQPGTICE